MRGRRSVKDEKLDTFKLWRVTMVKDSEIVLRNI